MTTVKRRRRRSKRKVPFDWLVETTTPHVLAEATRAKIEDMAAEFIRELHQDPTWKAEVRETVRQMVKRSFKKLHHASRT